MKTQEKVRVALDMASGNGRIRRERRRTHNPFTQGLVTQLRFLDLYTMMIFTLKNGGEIQVEI